MTYFNANVYVESPTQWACDDCLPETCFEYVDLGTDKPHRRQVAPWHWAPLYGGNHVCYVCGEAVK